MYYYLIVYTKPTVLV